MISRSTLAVVLVAFSILSASCAQAPPPKDEPDEVVGKPPTESSDSGPQAQRIGGQKIESPTGPCDELWANDEVAAAKCTQGLLNDLLINQDRRALAIIWPRAEIESQIQGPNGTRSEIISGAEFRDRLYGLLSRPNSSALLSAILAANNSEFSFELLSDGSVRASFSDPDMKVNEYYALIEGEMRLVRTVMIQKSR